MKKTDELPEKIKIIIVKLVYGTITATEADELEEWTCHPGNTKMLLRQTQEISKEKNAARNKFSSEKK
jgi:hypothetical protein